jgi:hypothetical protein
MAKQKESAAHPIDGIPQRFIPGAAVSTETQYLSRRHQKRDTVGGEPVFAALRYSPGKRENRWTYL